MFVATVHLSAVNTWPTVVKYTIKGRILSQIWKDRNNKQVTGININWATVGVYEIINQATDDCPDEQKMCVCSYQKFQC